MIWRSGQPQFRTPFSTSSLSCPDLRASIHLVTRLHQYILIFLALNISGSKRGAMPRTILNLEMIPAWWRLDNCVPVMESVDYSIFPIGHIHCADFHGALDCELGHGCLSLTDIDIQRTYFSQFFTLEAFNPIFSIIKPCWLFRQDRFPHIPRIAGFLSPSPK